MVTVNHNYLKLPGSYLFSTIAKKVKAYKEANPQANVISLGIGDVTQPLAPAIIEALHKSVDEMGDAATFHGYAPDLGYEFLRSAIAKNDYKDRGCDIEADEIFVSDGAKSDSGNIQEIFGLDNKIAVCDPVYPVYVDTNVMAGRTGEYNKERGNFDNVIYMPCTEANGFLPEFPTEVPDLIYLCFPNNPTGGAITKPQLQEWVDSSMTQHMKHISLKKTCRTAFTNAKEQEPAPSNSAAFPKTQALQESASASQSYQKIWYATA